MCILVIVIVHKKTNQLQLISLALALLQGMTTTGEAGTHLGRLVYDRDGAAFQTFHLPVSISDLGTDYCPKSFFAQDKTCSLLQHLTLCIHLSLLSLTRIQKEGSLDM